MAKERVVAETYDDGGSVRSRGNSGGNSDRTAGRGEGARGRGGNSARSKRAQAKGRGRSLIALVLVGFVLVASTVIWRRTSGITLVRALTELDRQRIQLESERAHLAGAIRDGSSRSRLLRIVEQQGMHVPNDQQVRLLPR